MANLSRCVALDESSVSAYLCVRHGRWPFYADVRHLGAFRSYAATAWAHGPPVRCIIGWLILT
jgi:hypothetical protein